jgi:voltage-dependent potassium channel beta subunit
MSLIVMRAGGLVESERYTLVMKYRKLGSSGLRVSEISLGGWITFGGTIEEGVAKSIVQRALEGGVNFIDLADVYCNGEAERVMGRMLGEFTRENLILSSKLFHPMSDDPNDRGLSRKHIVQSVERSLKNLGTDYLDFYFCHREDPETSLEETVRAMDDLVHQGKVLYWGTSVWTAEYLKRAHEIADKRNLYAPQVEQPHYNLMERGIERDVLPMADKLGMGVVVWSPLAGGMLTGKYNDGIPENSRAKTTNWLDGRLTEQNLDRLRRFSEIALRLEVRPEQLALAWILSRPVITSVITGASTPEQLESNLRAVELELTKDVRKELEKLFPRT